MNAEAAGGEPAQQPEDTRAFTLEGVVWTARIAGRSVVGTGRMSASAVVLVRFYREGERQPRFEAILPAGRLQQLYDAELAELLAAARRLPRA